MADKGTLLQEVEMLRAGYRAATEPTPAQALVNQHRSSRGSASTHRGTDAGGPTPEGAPSLGAPSPAHCSPLTPGRQATVEQALVADDDEPIVRAYVRAAFDAIDRLRSGSIESRDLRAALRRAGLAIDTDGAAQVLEELYDGQRLTLQEFAKLVADIEGMLDAAGKQSRHEPQQPQQQSSRQPSTHRQSPQRAFQSTRHEAGADEPRAMVPVWVSPQHSTGQNGGELPAHLEEELAKMKLVAKS